jgi:hypothetical protein
MPKLNAGRPVRLDSAALSRKNERGGILKELF